MATYSAKVSSGVIATKVDSIVGTNDTRVSVQLPDGSAPLEFTSGTGAGAINKMGYGSISLAAAATTVALDAVSSTITNWVGDTAFTKIKELYIYNAATAGTTKPVTVGAAASVAFVGPMGGTTPTQAIDAATALHWTSTEANGWSCSTNKNLKLDPGANTVTVYIVIAGN